MINTNVLTAEGTRKRGAELDLEADVGPLPLMVRSELCRRQNTTDCHGASTDCMIQTLRPAQWDSSPARNTERNQTS